MKYCETCEWFKSFEDSDEDYLARRYPGFGNCSNEIFRYDDEYSYENTKFIYADYEGYSAVFYVHKTFGCIGYQPKPGIKGFHDVDEFYKD